MCVAAAIAGAGVVGGVASSVIGGNAAEDAAQTQADAANNSAAMQEAQFQQTRSDLRPYQDLGTSLLPALRDSLTNPWLGAQFSYGNFNAPTQAEAQATPGYQFTLQQGLKAAQNSASARGLGSSGAALKGAESFASGLADSTYNDVFNRALQSYGTNRNNALNTFQTNYGVANDATNRLLGVVTMGQNSAAQTGALGAQTASSIGNTLMSGAASQAAGTVGAANAITGGISTAVNGGTNALLLNSLMNKQGSTLYGSATDAYGNRV